MEVWDQGEPLGCLHCDHFFMDIENCIPSYCDAANTFAYVGFLVVSALLFARFVKEKFSFFFSSSSFAFPNQRSVFLSFFETLDSLK